MGCSGSSRPSPRRSYSRSIFQPCPGSAPQPDSISCCRTAAARSTIDQLGAESRKFIAEARKRPELGALFTAFDPNYPQIKVELDRQKARTLALAHTGPATGILGGLIAYIAATAVAALALISAPIRHNIKAVNRGNARWFIYSGVLVAAAQGFFFCAVAVAPVLLVMPLLQLSLAFRLLFSTWLSPAHEVFGAIVIAGATISIAGALLVSIDTNIILGALAIPDAIAAALRWKI